MASSPPFPSPSPTTLRRSTLLTKTSFLIRKPSVLRRSPALLPVKALKEWREYEDALRQKDLARALRFLKSVELLPSSMSSSTGPASYSPADYSRPERNWEVLDACLNADDMRLVGSSYAFLQDRGLLPNFGKFKNIASKLAPKKWGLSGSSRALLIGFFGGVSFLLSQGIDIRPNLAAMLALGVLDAIFLGGSCLAQIQCFWPPYKRRILVHEAGHLLIAYLMGCPIRGVILDPIVAMQMGIQGQGFLLKDFYNE